MRSRKPDRAVRNASFLRRHLIVTSVVTLTLTLAALWLAFSSVQRSRRDAPASVLLLARMVDGAPARDQALMAQALRSLSGVETLPAKLWLFDARQRVLGSSAEEPMPYAGTRLPLPDRPYQYAAIDRQGGVIRLAGAEPRYLLVQRPSPGRRLVPTLIVYTAVSVVASSLLSFLFLVFYFRGKARLADGVISELQAGNLKARFPIKKRDELGQTMLRFNRMADEIERLVERLRSTERSRRQLLQELGHDLRTPIASLRTLLETLERAPREELRAEFTSLALKEVDYFGRLVEDLLFLAQMQEPKYRITEPGQRVEWALLLEEEIESLQAAHAQTGKRVAFEPPDDSGANPLRADPHLLRRLLRNALENALAFARREVTVRAQAGDGVLSIWVGDDGPGFPPEVLASFGERALSRKLTHALASAPAGGRISLGLGSVIMKAIAEAHGGSVSVANRAGPGGEAAGSELCLRLPLDGPA